MRYTTLISATELQGLLREHKPVMIFDCSFDLAQPAQGDAQFEQLRIAGAVRADLDRHLSAKEAALTHGVGKAAPMAASGGRHPLPQREVFAQWLGRIGFQNDMQAVVYDRQGSSFCVRLWWMLKWAGHEAVAVLDGGLPAWQAIQGPVASGPAAMPTSASQRPFQPGKPLARLVTVEEVRANLNQSSLQTVVDARAPARFRGEVEPLDPVAGHIPGALNRPFGDNFGPDGRFKSPAQLRAEFDALLGGRPPASVVHQCGSGVTATPNLLAMELAGLGRAALYAGSWSEWCSDPTRPVAKG
ncbi:sulfurtransferase [Hylemonella sp. W303a]|uniref:sulfurtransferase n=1 Tax=Hylemonella sp. W303a TaxID=3389873 RepID=UPI00396B1415